MEKRLQMHAKLQQIARKALGKTRKVGTEGESLYMGKCFEGGSAIEHGRIG